MEVTPDTCGVDCVGSNPLRLRFPRRRFFGTSTSRRFCQPPWESRKVEHKQKGNDGGRPPTPEYEFLRKAPEFLGFTLCNRPALAVSTQPFGVIGGQQGLLPLRCRRSPTAARVNLSSPDQAGTSSYLSDPAPTNIARTLSESSGVRVSIRSFPARPSSSFSV